MNLEGLRRNVRCEECGDLMRISDNPLCDRCRHPFITSGQGNGIQGHYDEDPSGASGSWDRVVRICEESEQEQYIR